MKSGGYILFLVLVFSLQVYADSGGTWEYYRSNSIGMALEKLEPDRIVVGGGSDDKSGSDDTEHAGSEGTESRVKGQSHAELAEDSPLFVLKRRYRAGRLREEVLLENQGEVYTLLYSYDQRGRVEEEYRDGKRVRETVFNEGRPVEEWRENGDKAPVEIRYEWDGAQLVAKRQKNTEGSKNRKSILYFLDSGGKLGEVERGEDISAYVTNSEGELLGEWHKSEGRTEVVRHGGRGAGGTQNDYHSRILENGDPVQRRSSYMEGEKTRVEEVDIKADRTLVAWYDSKNRLIERRTRREGILEREKYTYSGGMLRLKKVRSPHIQREYRYFYGEEGKRSKVEVYEDGELYKRVIYRDKNEREEVLFRNGEPLYKNLYRNEELIRREYEE